MSYEIIKNNEYDSIQIKDNIHYLHKKTISKF